MSQATAAAELAVELLGPHQGAERHLTRFLFERAVRSLDRITFKEAMLAPSLKNYSQSTLYVARGRINAAFARTLEGLPLRLEIGPDLRPRWISDGDMSWSKLTDQTLPAFEALFRTIHARSNISKAPFDVPFVPAEPFVGRTELLNILRKQLSQSGRRTIIGRCACIFGPGGFGKTQAAVQFAFRHRPRFTGGVFWLSCEEDIASQFLKTDLCSPSEASLPTPHAIRKSLAERVAKASVLLVFDDVTAPAEVLRWLPPPQSGALYVLVTARTDLESHGFPSFEVVPLLASDSRKLLLVLSGRKTSREDEAAIRRLLRYSRGWPLAIERMAAELREAPTVSLDRYARHLRKTALSLTPTRPFEARSATKHSGKLGVLLPSFQQAESPVAVLLSYFAATNLQRAPASLLAEIVGSSVSEIHFTLGDLVRLRILAAIKPGDFLLPEIFLQILRSHTNEVTLSERRVGEAVVRWFGARHRDVQDWKSFERNVQHLKVCFERARSAGILDLAARMSWLLSYSAYRRGRFRDALQYVQSAIDLHRAAGKRDPEFEDRLDQDLAGGHLGCEEYEQAIALYRQVIERRRSLIGPARIHTAEALSSLGVALGAVNKHDEALSCKQEALEILASAAPKDRARIAKFEIRVAVSKMRLGGRNVADAIKDLKQALYHLDKADFPDDAERARVHFWLAQAHKEIGDIQSATTHIAMAIDLRTKLFRHGHKDLAACHSLRATLAEKMGDQDQAVAQSIAAVRTTPEEDWFTAPTARKRITELIDKTRNSTMTAELQAILQDLASSAPSNDRLAEQILERLEP
jgi:tetratricopeptide (TPR) repeat protein